MNYCQTCHAPIRWAITPLGARIPLDYRPDPAGDVTVYTDAVGSSYATVNVEAAAAGDIRYRRHPHP
jgi:hypothetical protein